MQKDTSFSHLLPSVRRPRCPCASLVACSHLRLAIHGPTFARSVAPATLTSVSLPHCAVRQGGAGRRLHCHQRHRRRHEAARRPHRRAARSRQGRQGASLLRPGPYTLTPCTHTFTLALGGSIPSSSLSFPPAHHHLLVACKEGGAGRGADRRGPPRGQKGQKGEKGCGGGRRLGLGRLGRRQRPRAQCQPAALGQRQGREAQVGPEVRFDMGKKACSVYAPAGAACRSLPLAPLNSQGTVQDTDGSATFKSLFNSSKPVRLSPCLAPFLPRRFLLKKKKEKPSRLTAAPALASSGRVKGRRVNLHRARRNDKVLHVGLIKNAGTRQAPFGPTPRHGPCPFLIKFRTFDSIKRHDRGTARYKAAAYFSLAAQTRKTQEARTTHALYPPPTGTTARTSHHAQNGRATAAATPQDLKVVV